MTARVAFSAKPSTLSANGNSPKTALPTLRPEETEMTTEEVLIAAREKIADEKNWTQKEYLRGGSGEPLMAKDVAKACQFCAIGAVFAALCDVEYCNMFAVECESPYILALNRASGGSIFRFNDSHTHAEVLGIFDEAIASEQARSAPAR